MRRPRRRSIVPAAATPVAPLGTKASTGGRAPARGHDAARPSAQRWVTTRAASDPTARFAVAPGMGRAPPPAASGEAVRGPVAPDAREGPEAAVARSPAGGPPGVAAACASCATRRLAGPAGGPTTPSGGPCSVTRRATPGPRGSPPGPSMRHRGEPHGDAAGVDADEARLVGAGLPGVRDERALRHRRPQLEPPAALGAPPLEETSTLHPASRARPRPRPGTKPHRGT